MAERIPPKPAAPGAASPGATPTPTAPATARPAPREAPRPGPIPAPRGRAPAGGATSARARVLGQVGGRTGARSQDAPSDEAELVARGPRAKVGDPDTDAASLAAMSVLLAAEHLTVVMAKRRGAVPREALIGEMADLLLASENADFVRRVLAAMGEQERIHDIYPLELLARCLDRRPDLVDTHRFTPFVLNRRELAQAAHPVETPIRLQIPLSATVKALALEGGGAPGYHLYPGAPTEYLIELGAAGTFNFLLRAEVRRESVIDRFTITVVDEPDEPERA